MIIRTTLAAIGASIALSSLATDYVWSGKGDGKTWSNPANWDRTTAIAWTADDTATFESSVDVTVDDDVEILQVKVTGSGTEVTLSGTGSLNMTSSASAGGFSVGEGAVLDVDIPVVFESTRRQELSGRGTIRFLNRYTLKTATKSYSSLKNVVFTKGAVMDTTANTGTGNFALGIAADYEVGIRMEEDAELKLFMFNLANGSPKSKSVTFTQEGVDTRLSSAESFFINNGATVNPMHYVLKSGTLTVGKSVGVTTEDGTGGGDFTQEGGTVTVKGGFALNNGDAFFKGGSCSVGGALTSARGLPGKAYLFNGAKLDVGSLAVPLNLCAGTSADPAELHFGNSQAATNVISDWTFEPGAKVKVTADAALALVFEKDSPLPDGLDIGANVTVYVEQDVQLTALSTVPPAIAIRNGGHLNLHGQTSYLATPIDLTIDNGGQLWADEVSGGNRGIIVAHSYTLAGVAQKGRITAENSAAAAFRGKVSCDLYVPCTWTGAAGDGDIDNKDNWENGGYSYWSSNALLDFSHATEPIILKDNTEYVEAAIAFLPPKGAEGTLKLVNAAGKNNSFKLRGVQKKSFRSTAFCRKGCAIEFDVKFKNYDSWPQIGWCGGGTFRFCRELDAGCPNYFLLDGVVEIASTLKPSTGLRFFALHGSTDRAVVRFVDGADVSLSETLTLDNNDGYTSGHAYEQTGGAVTVADLCLTATRYDSKSINTYTQSGGTLTVTDDLNLGGMSTLVTTKNPYTTGTFVLTGGTLVAPKVSLALNQNWCRLQGGVARIGANGFVKAPVTTFTESRPNTTPGLEFGGVTFDAANSWTAASTLDVNLTGEGGWTTFDVAAGQTVTLAGAVTGVGGFVKKGAGDLALTGAYSATGDIKVEAGTVSFGSVAGSSVVDTLDVADEGSVFLASGQELSVRHLIVGGSRKAIGNYTFGNGQVAVLAPETGYAWIGPQGGNWSDTSNWYGGNVPNGSDVVLDFSASPVPMTIAVDTAVALKGLLLDMGKVTLVAGTDGVLSLHAAEVNVEDGAELCVEAETRIARVTGENFSARVRKTGGGVFRLTGMLRSGDEPSELVFGQGAVLETVAGETEIACEVAGVHVYPLSTDAAVIPTVRLVEGAVMTNAAWLTGTFSPYEAKVAAYGAVVMDGGDVAVTKKTTDVFGSNGVGQDGTGNYAYKGKNCFAWFYEGSSSFTVNGGAYAVGDFSDGNTYMNLNNTTSGGGQSVLTVNGGRVSLDSKRLLGLGMQDGACDIVNLNGGTLSTRGTINRQASTSKDCQTCLNLKGGVLEVTGPESRSVDFGTPTRDPIAVVIGGDLTISVAHPSCVLSFDSPVEGETGKVSKLGAGTVVFRDQTGLAETNKFDLSVRDGLMSLEGVGMNFGRIDFSGSGLLGLQYDGARDADALYINGRQSGRGLYGTTGRKATRFVGTGLLNVLTGENYGMSVIIR